MDELGMQARQLYPLPTSTYYLMGQGGGVNVSTLPSVDTAMWWEPGSASDYALGKGPLRPLARPTPFQWLIFTERAKDKLSYEAVATLAGSDEKGQLLTASNVHRLERSAPKRVPGDRAIRGLATALNLGIADIRDALARSISGQTDDAHLEIEARRLLAKADEMDERTRSEWVEAAHLLADAFLRASRGRPRAAVDAGEVVEDLYGLVGSGDDLEAAFQQLDGDGEPVSDPRESDS
ncbi:hypothetical protein [Frankia sp. R82]|uniref:hypothetical protein n=1 Tax=Frankia sp. R82 TaxID=2950553 RepID=UPI00204423F5|nr:hypothetical protein [Frankia sp. R82]MCM3884184.1 hypothetical protein [Frankia sp. R82]